MCLIIWFFKWKCDDISLLGHQEGGEVPKVKQEGSDCELDLMPVTSGWAAVWLMEYLCTSVFSSPIGTT